MKKAFQTEGFFAFITLSVTFGATSPGGGGFLKGD